VALQLEGLGGGLTTQHKKICYEVLHRPWMESLESHTEWKVNLIFGMLGVTVDQVNL